MTNLLSKPSAKLWRVGGGDHNDRKAETFVHQANVHSDSQYYDHKLRSDCCITDLSLTTKRDDLARFVFGA